MTGWLAETTLAVTLLLVAVLLLRKPVARRFGAHAAYALWAAPALRLVMPPIDHLPRLFPQAASSDMWIEVSVSDAAASAPAAMSFPWVLTLWAAGAAIYLTVQLFRHRRFIARAIRQAREIGTAGPARIVASPAVDGPLATGLVRRLILVPDDFDARFAPRERALALLHEQLHHQRLDLWAAAASLAFAAALWFNPLVRAALAAFRQDMEASCDASVLARTGREARADYADTLLRSACPRVPRSLCALTSIDDLKGRLTMLDQSTSGVRRASGLLLAATISAAGLTLAAPAAALADRDPPAPPAAPALPASPAAPTLVAPPPPAPPAPPVKGSYKIVRLGGDGTTSGTYQIDQDKADGPVHKEVRVVEVHKDGKTIKWTDKDGTLHAPECGGTPTEVTTSNDRDGKKEQAKIVICTKGETSKGDQVKHLEEAIGRLQSNSDMDAAIRADLVAKLQAKVAELRAQP